MALNEVWKDVVFNNDYMVSNYGNVKSKDRTIIQKKQTGVIVPRKISGRLLIPEDNGNGYLKVKIWDKGKADSYFVHRLVAEAFIGSVSGKVVNHLDYNTHNNQVSNLEIVTQKQNINYSKVNRKDMWINRLINIQTCGIRQCKNAFELTIFQKYIGRYSTLENAIDAKYKYLKEIGYGS